MNELVGSSICPVCGQDTPHYHNPKDVEKLRAAQAKLAALTAPGEYGDFVARLNDMASRERRYNYSIGDYWNAVDEAATAIEQLQARVREIEHNLSLPTNKLWHQYIEQKERAEQADAKLAEYKEDAERYLWWQAHPRSYFVIYIDQEHKTTLQLHAVVVADWDKDYRPENVMAAIDAARRKEPT